jgi:uncharacterized membrane protein YhaH (DUF805 family)
MSPFLSLLFGFRHRVDRRLYFRVGVVLMLLKYAVDATVITLTTGRLWTPVDYLVPLLSLRSAAVEALPAWLTTLLILWTLPFIWIGVSMTMRRAVDAGRSPWLCLLFFVPVINYVVMLALSMLPSAPNVDWDSGPVPATVVDRIGSAVAGVGAALVIGVVAVLVSTIALESYGLALFLATPFLLGMVSAFVYNHGHPRTSGATFAVVCLSLFVVGGSLILFALEGLLCIVMALPLGLVLAFFGGAIGRAIAVRSHTNRPGIAYGLLLLPMAGVIDSTAPPAPLIETVTAIVIAAPPERVWDEVIAFREIDERPSLAFRLGIAYPIRASLTGTGVGAVRRCEFSTGAFVEPITVWEPPHRLAFDVAEQPPVLEEWSPYRKVYAPHVRGFFRSERGEFRMVALPDGRTRLEGSTWYALHMHPRPYWRAVSDLLLHSIHERVLAQVKRQAEGPAVASASQ